MPKTSSRTTTKPIPTAAARRTMSCCGSDGGPIAAGAGLRGRVRVVRGSSSSKKDRGRSWRKSWQIVQYDAPPAARLPCNFPPNGRFPACTRKDTRCSSAKDGAGVSRPQPRARRCGPDRPRPLPARRAARRGRDGRRLPRPRRAPRARRRRQADRGRPRPRRPRRARGAGRRSAVARGDRRAVRVRPRRGRRLPRLRARRGADARRPAARRRAVGPRRAADRRRRCAPRSPTPTSAASSTATSSRRTSSARAPTMGSSAPPS